MQRHINRSLLIAAILALAASATAQTPDVKIPEYSVVSIKQDKSDTGSFSAGNTPQGIAVKNASLLMIIRFAYGLFSSLDDKFIGVPGWAKDEKFDIEAKVDPSDIETLHKLSRNQRNLMIQGILADRFKLKTHPEIREQPIYALTVSKNGSKLREAKPGDTYPNGLKDFDGRTGAGVVRRTNDALAGQAIPMSSLVVILTQIVGRTVTDKTGLTGDYDVALNWTPDSATTSSPDNAGPSIFTALQEQLGLKLEATKGPVDVLVVDHVERPSVN